MDFNSPVFDAAIYPNQNPAEKMLFDRGRGGDLAGVRRQLQGLVRPRVGPKKVGFSEISLPENPTRIESQLVVARGHVLEGMDPLQGNAKHRGCLIPSPK